MVLFWWIGSDYFVKELRNISRSAALSLWEVLTFQISPRDIIQQTQTGSENSWSMSKISSWSVIKEDN